MSTKEKRSVQNIHGMDIHLLSRCQFPRKGASPAGRYRCPVGRRRSVRLLENQRPLSDRPQFRLSESFKWRPCYWHGDVGNGHLEVYSEDCIRERFLCGCLSRKGKRRVKPRQILTPSFRKSAVSFDVSVDRVPAEASPKATGRITEAHSRLVPLRKVADKTQVGPVESVNY
jgi:hypothetical protein